MTLLDYIEKTSSEILMYKSWKKGFDSSNVEFTKDVINKSLLIVDIIQSTFENFETVPNELNTTPCSNNSVDICLEMELKSITFTITRENIDCHLYDGFENFTEQVSLDDDSVCEKLIWLINNN